MKKAITVLVGFNLLMIDFIVLSFVSNQQITTAIMIAAVCFKLMQLSWIVFALCFFMPYIKRGIHYLISHRDD